MARHDVNKKSSVIDSVKKFVQVRTPVIPNDKYEAYQLALKKAHEKLKVSLAINYALAVVVIVALTIIFTR